MKLKTEGYRISMYGLILVPNNINNPIFTIFIFIIVHNSIDIISRRRIKRFN